MPRRTVLLIIVLTLITISLLYSALHSAMPSHKSSSFSVSVVTPMVEKTATISFDPPSLRAKPNSLPQTTNVIVSTGNSNVTGVQVVLSYDSRFVKNVKISPSATNLFGESANYNVIKNIVDDAAGKATFIIVIPPKGQSEKGSGAIATVTFTPVTGSNIPETAFSFTTETKVTKVDEEQSVLKSTNPFVIYFEPTTLPSTKTK